VDGYPSLDAVGDHLLSNSACYPQFPIVGSPNTSKYPSIWMCQGVSSPYTRVLWSKDLEPPFHTASRRTPNC
jgi:hypothetical protein